MQAINFIKTALKDYKVGAVTISSKYVVRRVSRELPKEARVIVEYGAGDGIITKAILQKMPADGRLIAVELNADFLSELERIRDKRLTIINKDVIDFLNGFSARNFGPVDAVVSGIPFTFFQPQTRRAIAERTNSILSSEGVFVVYQYSLLMFPVLKKIFQRVSVGFEPRNLPPYFVITAKK